MNLILLEREELGRPLPEDDVRTRHVRSVLKSGAGCRLRAGLVNGPEGELVVLSVEGGLAYEFVPLKEPKPLFPLTLVIGAPRPLVTKRLLKDLSSLGVEALRFVRTELGEKSYLESSLWTKEEFRRHLREGAEQASATLLPEVELFPGLEACLKKLPGSSRRLALDPARGEQRLQEAPLEPGRIVLAVGPERGWTEGEIAAFGRHGFTLHRLGERILRTEAACLAASAIVLSRLGYI